MKKALFALFLISFSFNAFSQVLERQDQPNNRVNDTLNGRQSSTSGIGKNPDAKIQDYQIISFARDTTFVDTTLTIQKEYKYNYLRRDYFDLLPFNNIGQTFNRLSYEFDDQSVLPRLGARARHFNHMEIEDINYYRMPTPFTELLYKTAFEQGQVLDAFFSVNLNPRYNFSVAYKGLRSLGKYQHILTSTGNFRFTSNYTTKNGRYRVRGHIVMQDQSNEENGGIRDEDIVNFESGNEEFIDRSVFDPNFEDAVGILVGRRFYIDHEYDLFKTTDSLNNNALSIGNITYYKDKYFRYEQTNANEVFGESFTNSIYDRSNLEHFYAEGNAKYNSKTIGRLEGRIGFARISYGYDQIIQVNGQRITNRINDEIISVGGSYNKDFGKFNLYGDFTFNVSGDFNGNNLNIGGSYSLNDDLSISAQLLQNSRQPNYNFLLHQSDYLNYNWQNDYDNVQTKRFTGRVISKKWFDIEADFTTVNNYTYFVGNTEGIIKPTQLSNTLTYFRIKAQNELKYRNFALNTTLRYQNVSSGSEALQVPDLNVRATLYYANHVFKKALYLQTGVSCTYFTEYFMNAYDPVLAELYVQNEQQFGAFPRLDFFINAKVRQTRIFIKAEHFNSSFTGYNFYSAPNYPYRDFNIRFGLVWNFFL